MRGAEGGVREGALEVPVLLVPFYFFHLLVPVCAYAVFLDFVGRWGLRPKTAYSSSPRLCVAGSRDGPEANWGSLEWGM